MAKNSKHGFTLRKILAANIRQLRKKLGLSQEKLADLCGLHRTYVGSIEREERNATLSSIEAFAKALKVPAANLLMENLDVSSFNSGKNKS